MTRRVVALLAGLAALLLASMALAQDVLNLEIVTDVVEGTTKPGLRIKANTDLDRLSIRLRRDDGREFHFDKRQIAPRASLFFDIAQEAGTHRYQGSLTVKNGEEDGEMPLDFSLNVLAGLKLTLVPGSFDRDRHRLELNASRPLERIEWSVMGDTGRVIGKGTTPCQGQSAIPLEWALDEPGTPIRIDLKGIDPKGAFAALELSPWWVEVEHEEVHFPSGSAEIPASESSKLDATYAKLEESVTRFGKLVKLTLYVAGYTDTVGNKESNRELSLRRARAIATYFRHKGFAFPILAQGFGEDVPAVPTPDETDSLANRRAVYVLGSDMPPRTSQFPLQNWEPIR